MAFQLNQPLSEEEIKRRENINQMAELIVTEMKKRGLEPTDGQDLCAAIERETYKQTKEIWK